MINKAVLFLYHVSGTLLLYGVLVWTLWFCGKLLFYVCNNSWIVPAAITKEDPAVLDAAQKMITTGQALDALTLEAAKDEEEKTKTTGHHWNSDSDADPDSKSKTAKPQSSRVFWTRRRYQRQPALNGNKNSGKLDV